MALEKVPSGFDTRIGNTPVATIVWDAICGTSVTNYDKNLNVVLAAFAGTSLAHGNEAFNQSALYYRLDGGTWTLVTGATAVAMATNGALTEGSAVGATAGCQTSTSSEEWTTTGGTFNISAPNGIGEAQFGLDISAVGDGVLIEFSLNDGAVVLDVSITTAAGVTSYETFLPSNLRVNVTQETFLPSILKVRVLDNQKSLPSTMKVIAQYEEFLPSSLRVLATQETFLSSLLKVRVADNQLSLSSLLRVTVSTETFLPTTLRVLATQEVFLPTTLRVLLTSQLSQPSTLRVILTSQLSLPSNLQVIVGSITYDTFLPSNLRVLLTSQLSLPSNLRVILTDSIFLSTNLRVLLTSQLSLPTVLRVKATQETFLPSTLRVVVSYQTFLPSILRVNATQEIFLPTTLKVRGTQETFLPSTLRVAVSNSVFLPTTLRVNATQEIFLSTVLKVRVEGQQTFLPSTMRIGVFEQIFLPTTLKVRVEENQLSLSSILKVRVTDNQLSLPSTLRVSLQSELFLPTTLRVLATIQKSISTIMRVKVLANQLVMPSSLRVALVTQISVPTSLRVKVIGNLLNITSTLRIKVIGQQLSLSTTMKVVAPTSVSLPTTLKVKVLGQQVFLPSQLRVITPGQDRIILPTNLKVIVRSQLFLSSRLRVAVPPLFEINVDDTDVGIVRKLMAQAGREVIRVHADDILPVFYNPNAGEYHLYTDFQDIMDVQHIRLVDDINHDGTNYLEGSVVNAKEGKIQMSLNLPDNTNEILITYATRDGLDDEVIQLNIDMAKYYLQGELWRETLNFSGSSTYEVMAKWTLYSIATYWCILGMNSSNAIQSGYNYRIAEFEIQTKLWGEGMIAETLLNKYWERSMKMINALKMFESNPEPPLYVVSRGNSMTPYNKDPTIFHTMTSMEAVVHHDSVSRYAVIMKIYG